jgi:PHD/YefM family antitoxin component YafN of YafNO toxin-antitoxin module
MPINIDYYLPYGRKEEFMTRKNKQQMPMVRHLPITKARINLGSVVKQVHLNKEYVVLEKDGIPIAALMDVDEFEDYLELQDPKVKRDIEISRKESSPARAVRLMSFWLSLRPKRKESAASKSEEGVVGARRYDAGIHRPHNTPTLIGLPNRSKTTSGIYRPVRRGQYLPSGRSV